MTTAVGGIAGCTETEILPPTISDEKAKKRALDAEEEYVFEHLQNAPCLTSWGTAGTPARKAATVIKRTTEGVRVEVTHPYWFSTNDMEVDATSRAVYLVSPDSVQRVSGDEIDPC